MPPLDGQTRNPTRPQTRARPRRRRRADRVEAPEQTPLEDQARSGANAALPDTTMSARRPASRLGNRAAEALINRLRANRAAALAMDNEEATLPEPRADPLAVDAVEGAPGEREGEGEAEPPPQDVIAAETPPDAATDAPAPEEREAPDAVAPQSPSDTAPQGLQDQVSPAPDSETVAPAAEGDAVDAKAQSVEAPVGGAEPASEAAGRGAGG